MAVVLALFAALSYGLSDFLGGIASKRAGAWSVAAVTGVGGGLTMSIVALASGQPPTMQALALGAAAGLGNGFGTGFLYRGLAAGRMGVVAPVSGVTTAVLPVAVGLISGERPSLLVWAGILVALPAIWLVAQEPDDASRDSATSTSGGSGVFDGVLAGVGFGALFAVLAQVPERDALWTLTVNQLIGIVAIVALAALLGADSRPRHPWAALGLLSGLLGACATLSFQVSTRHGLLTVTSVLASLYPAGTVLLAVILLRERVHRSQVVGLALCAVTVVSVALG